MIDKQNKKIKLKRLSFFPQIMAGKTVLEALHDKYGGTDSGVCDIYLPASAPGKTGRLTLSIIKQPFPRHTIGKKCLKTN